MRPDTDRAKGMLKGFILKLLLFLLLFGFCFLILYPFILKIMSAVKSPEDINDKTVGLIPKHFSMYYFELAASKLNLIKSGMNTLALSLIASVSQVLICTVTAYGLARFKFAARNAVFICVMVVLIIPPQAYSVAMYLDFRFFTVFDFNLINNPLSLFLLCALGVGFKSGLYIYLLRNFFTNLPKELENAAYVDGAGPIVAFFRIILPNAAVMMSTVFLFSFCWQWTDTFYSDLLFPKTDTFSRVVSSIQVFSADKGFYDSYATTIVQNAACIIVIIPLIAIFLICQRFLIKSIATTGLAN